MANLTETTTYTSGVYQLERTDPVDAGVSGSGLANLQALQLSSRTNYLKTVLDAVGLDLANTSLRIPALAIASLPPASSNTRKLFFATDANAGAGVIVVSNGTNWIDLRTGATVTTAATSIIANASDTLAGIVQLATNAEAITGTNALKAITAASLQAKINAIPALGAATTTTAGVVLLATNGEALTGTDAAKSITPAALQAKISAIPSATTSTAGLVPLATNAESLTGTDTTKAITAAALQAKVNTVTSPAASTSVAGIIQIATPAQVQSLTVNDRTITPLALAGLIPSMSAAQGQFARVNSAGNAFVYGLENTTSIISVAGGAFTALANRYHFFQSACTVALPIAPPEGTFIAFFNAQGSGTITISAAGTNANGSTLAAGARANLIYANSNWRNIGFTGGVFVASGSAAFDYTGVNQTWVVPAGVTSATALLWAAGGGGSNESVGGGSGFCQATFTVTAAESITVIVGQAGICFNSGTGNSAANYGGGGLANRRLTKDFGSGGGRSAIRRSTTELLTAGAGGGAGGSGTTGGGNIGSGSGSPGGGTIGGSYIDSFGGQGGTQSVGGVAGNPYAGNAAAGGAFFGGNASTTGSASASHGGPGGGSGYYGGGAADYQGAGGGSSFIGVSTTSPTTTLGSGASAANNTHPNYSAGVGNGGSIGSAGGNGRAVIVWG